MTSMAGIRKIRIMGMEPDIGNTTLNEYLEYEATKERQLWDNVQSRRSLTNYDEADVDSFHQNKIGAKNMKRMGQDIFQVSIWEHDDDLEEDQEDDGDNRDTFDITATKPILDKLLEDKILNVAMANEKADLTRDLEELERLLVENPHFTEIQVHTIITKTEPYIHTQPISPLYGIFESYKSSTKPYKVDREMKSPSSYYRIMHMEGCLVNYWLQERISNLD
ncbi:hypothetical protein Tco_0830718 [Tanacetum coccineum]